MIGALLFVCAFALMLSASGASAASPQYEYQNITTDTTWAADSVHILNQSITVQSGATLTIGSNVTVMADQNMVLKVNGTLIVTGATGKLVNFTENKTGLSWGGIVLNPSAKATLDLAYINNATTGITGTNAMITLTKVGFYDIDNNAIYLTYKDVTSSVTITGCNFMRIGYSAIDVIEIDIDSNNIGTHSNVTTVPVTITNNRFKLGAVSDAIGVYQDASAFNQSSSTINGNVIVTGNWINSTDVNTDGIWIQSDVYTHADAKATITSNFDLNNNSLGWLSDSIYAERYIESANKSTALISGYTNINGNKIDESYDDSIELYTYIEAEGSSSATISGDFTARSNTVNDTDEYAIFQDSEVDLYDNATGIISIKTTVDSNNIVYVNDRGVYIYRDYEIYSKYHATLTATGDIIVTKNVVKESDNDALQMDLYVNDDTDYNGVGVVSLTSSYTVTGNIVNYADDDSMYIDEELYAYDNSTLTYVSPINMSNNVIYAAGYGPDIYRDVEAYGNATVKCTGDIVVFSNHMVDLSEGIYVGRYFDAEDYNSTLTAVGNVNITHNQVGSSSVWEGIYEELEAYSSAYAQVKVTGDVTITNNQVNSTEDDVGIQVYRDNLEAYDNSKLNIVESITVNNNVIGYSYEESIYVYIEIDAHDNCTLNVTEPVIISGNVLKSNDDAAISFERYVIANMEGDHDYNSDIGEVNGKAVVNIAGDLTIQNNIGPDNLDYGIYVRDNAYSYSGATLIVHGAIQVLNNDMTLINSDDNEDTILYVYRYLESNDNSKASWTGTMSVLRNKVVGLDYEGLDFSDAVYAYGDSTAVLTGGAVVSNNTITIQSSLPESSYDTDGMDVGATAYADAGTLNGAATATYAGNVLVADNNIKQVNIFDGSIGIDAYLTVNANGYTDARWSNASMGNILIVRNTVIMSGSDSMGISLSSALFAVGNDGNSAKGTVGSQIVTQNNVAMTGNGLTGIYWYANGVYAGANNGTANLLTGKISFNNNVVNIIGSNGIGIQTDLANYPRMGLVLGSYETDMAAFASAGGKATVNVLGGFNIVDNTINVNGANGQGVVVRDFGVTATLEDPILRGIMADADGDNSVAIFMANITVSGNVVTMKGTNSYGISVGPLGLYTNYFVGNATLMSSITVTGNTVAMGGVDGTGIYIEVSVENNMDSFDGKLVAITTVTVAENTITNGAIGIDIYDSTKVYVTDNSVMYTTEEGLYVEGSNVIVEKNMITENEGTGAWFYNCPDATSIVIGNNTISDNAGEGLNITNVCTGVKMYNGVFTDNGLDGIYVPAGSDVEWIIDAATSVRNNDVYICGIVDIRNGGTLTLDSVNYFTVGEAYNGYTEMKVKVGGSLIVLNSKLYSDNGKGQFLVYGNLQMMSSAEYEWSQIYLANTSTAKITASTIANNDRNGIYIDGCNPTISSSTIALNGMDGIYIDAGSAPLIKSCHIALNQRGIYARNANLDNVVDNIFLLNYVAGIYTDGVVGKIHANTFLLDKNEIFVYDSVVSIEDNQIGYANQVDQLVKYSTILSLILSYVDTKSITSGMLGSGDDLLGASTLSISSSLMSSLTSMLLEHVGLYAVNSDVIAKDNTYGLLTYAVYAENSSLSFSDSVQNNVIVMEWLNGNLDSRNITIPTYVYNGIYMIDSKLTMDGANIQCVNDAVFLDHSNAVITNSVLNASRFDIYSIHGSNVSVSMTTFDGKLKVEDAGWITFLNQFTIIVKDGDGKLVSGAPVTVVDGNGKLIASGNTSANGEFHADVIGWTQTASGKQTVSTPYWVNATVGGKTISQTADGSQSQTITAQAEKNPMDAVWLPLLLIIALIVVVVVIMVVLRSRKN